MKMFNHPVQKLGASGLLATLVCACSPAGQQQADPIQQARLALDQAEYLAHVETLASDEFGGRAPFSKGEERTLAYLEDQFTSLGLEPGNGDSYRQAVDLVEITLEPSAQVTLSHGGAGPESLQLGRDVVVWTKRVAEAVEIESSELVFVGFGIVAPEYGRNDYAGLDVKGKTVVMLVNDPGYHTQDENVFNGSAMTYYGRWTYKYEEAARQGAAGALIIHETGAAGYGWDVVAGSWTGPQFDLSSANSNMHRVKVEGWISRDAARAMMSANNLDLDQLEADAVSNNYQPVALETRLSASLRNRLRESQSYNVLAKIPGRVRPDEYFVYMAHWDHLGFDLAGSGDRIFNGAVDNATGVAALLELAQAFQTAPAPERSVLFLAVTAEESGLLGSAFYAENPIYPHARTVAGINIDAMNVTGPTNDIVVVGYGSSEMEDYLRTEADRQGRVVTQEPTPEKGYFYRSDHFNFAKKGVPVLYAEGGVDDREKGTQYGLAKQAEYVAERYHKPGDEVGEDWNLTGVIEDLDLFLTIGMRLANSSDWPQWFEGNEFRAAREASLAAQE